MICNTQGSVPTVRIPFETATSGIYIEQTLKEGFIVKSQKVIKK